jgi:hypothetical protein
MNAGLTSSEFMNRLVKILLALAGAGLLLVAVGAVGLTWWVKGWLKADVWVVQAEAAWNCRAEIGEVEVDLFTSPAEVRLKEVRIGTRDEWVGLPPAERPPMAAKGPSAIYVPAAVMAVELQDLLNQRLNVGDLRFVRPEVRESTDAEGRSSLESLFSSPRDVALDAVPAAIPVAPPSNGLSAVPVAVPVAAEPPSSGSVSVGEDRVVAPVPEESSNEGLAWAIEQASIEDGLLEIDGDDVRVRLSGLDFVVSEIDIDPRNVLDHNRVIASLACRVEVDGLARVGSGKRDVRIADLQVDGSASMVPLDEYGRWNPETLLDLILARGSQVAGFMTIGEAAGNNLGKLEQYGINLRDVPVGGELMEDARVRCKFSENQFTMIEELRLAFPDYELAIEPGSWLNTARDAHDMRLRLSCGPSLQERIQRGVAEAKLGNSIASAVVKALADERGRMTFDIHSSGSLSDPKVRPSVERVLGNLLKGRGLGDLLQGLLKKF